MTLQRILTAAILIPLVVAAVLYGPTLLIAVLVGVLILLALREFFALAARAGVPGCPRYTFFCVGLVVAQVCVSVWEPPYGRLEPLVSSLQRFLPSPLTVLGIFVFGVAILIICSQTPSFSAMGTSAAAVLFVALPLLALVGLRDFRIDGPQLLLFVLVLIWVGDTFAYFVGRRFGRHAMAPRISPNKTWEGAVANLAGSLLIGVIFSRWTGTFMAQDVFAAGLGNIAGQIGDLLESAYKRAAGVKDSGTLLPGHGGILDRIDSLIFAAPVVWYYFSVVIQGRS